MDTTGRNTEQIILEAAEQEFLLHGFEGTKTTDIANRAGVNHALLHYYYRTKENLFNRIFEQKMQLFGSALVDIFNGSTLPLVDQIVCAAGKHFDFLADNPGMSRLLLTEVLCKPSRMEQLMTHLDKLKEEVLQPMQEALDSEADAGRMARIDAVMLLMNIVQLNICAVVIQPYVQAYADNFGERCHFLALRREENLCIIRKRLAPDSEETKTTATPS